MTSVSSTPLTKLIADLVSIDSVNPSLDQNHDGETELARHVAQWSEAQGLEVQWLEATPGRPSLIVTARGSGEGGTLLLNAHLDTVGVTGMDEPFTPNVHEGRMYGRGAFDMKASLAACMLTLTEAKRLGLPGDVILTAVADEEHDSIGTQETLAALAGAGVKPTGAIVAEPSDLELHVAHRGFAIFEVEFGGRASHTAKPEAGVNALTHLGRLLAAVEQAGSELAAGAPHPLLGHGSLQPVLASGGQELYTTPAAASVTLERRTIPGETQEAVLAEVNELLNAMKRADPTVKATVRTVLAREPFEVAESSDIVIALAGAAETVTGRPAPLVGAPYWTDAALVAAAGVPTLLYGPKGGGIHQPSEWVDLSSVDTVHKVFVEAAKAICGAPR